jgi:molybdate transport system ATP-binding protein
MTVRARLVSRRGDFTLDVDLSVPGSGVTALFGPSGAGKTTLLRALAGLDRGVRGSLSVGGEIWQEGERALPPHRRALGYVFQEPSLFSHLTVRRNLEYGLRRVPAAERRVDLDRAVALLGLGPLLDRDPAGLSGGERQRVAIGRVLVTSPRLLLMDEPLAALDRESKAGIFPLLERLCEELAVPVLYVSHAADEVARLADHLALMEHGRIRAVGPVAEMFTRLDLPLAYGDTAEAVITATVAGHDDAYHLTHLDFPGGRFAVPREKLERGRRVRVRVLARDVSLTLERQTGTSILNIFPVRVTEVATESPAQVMVRLDAGGTPVLARVTRRSAADLGLEPGGLFHAQVKSVALLA